MTVRYSVCMGRERKKILFVITKSVWGGAQKYVFDLAQSLKDHHDVAVVAGGDGPLIDACVASNVRTIPLPAFERDISFVREVRAFFSLLRIFRHERPDIVHVNSSKAGGLGAFAARLSGIPRIVFTAHGWAFKEVWRSSISRGIIALLSWVTVFCTHTTIVVSRDDLVHTQWMIGVRKKLVHIHNGISDPTILSRERARDTLYDIVSRELPTLTTLPDNGTIWIGMIAELTANKGLGYALRGFAQHAETHQNTVLFIIGEGEEHHTLSTLIEKYGLVERVFLTGRIADAAQLIPAFDIFMLTSLKEGLPYTLLEAGYANVSVIATEVGGVPEIITDMVSGVLIPPKDSDAVAGALNHLTEEPDTRDEMRRALREHVQENFSLETMVKKTEEVYTSLDM